MVARRKEGNLVVFSGHSAFIGSGKKVYHRRLVLDVSRGKEIKDGIRGHPEPFSSLDAWVERRPGRLSAPPSSVNKGLLSAAALHPSPEARTYVCVEIFDRLWEMSLPRQLTYSLGGALLKTPRALLTSPYEAIRARRRPRVARRRQAQQRGLIERGYVFDYGAQRSIREDACGRQRHHYFLARDETMYILLAQQTLIRAVENFLDEHGVDLGQFNDQVKIILDKSINVGNINDSSGVVVGDNSSASVNDSSKESK